ncbi:hypothetical protein HKD37_18G050364 [Glycine soja]
MQNLVLESVKSATKISYRQLPPVTVKKLSAWHRGMNLSVQMLPTWLPTWVSQLTLRREGETRLEGASSKKGKRVESPPTFIRGKR